MIKSPVTAPTARREWSPYTINPIIVDDAAVKKPAMPPNSPRLASCIMPLTIQGAANMAEMPYITSHALIGRVSRG